MALVKIFVEKDTDFTTDGDATLYPVSATVTETLDSDYYLEIEVAKKYAIEPRSIVAVDYKDSWQGFRVGQAEEDNGYYKYKCWHVSYDAQDYIIKDLLLDDQPFNSAIAQVQAAITDETDIEVVSSLTMNVDLEIHYNSLMEVITTLINNYGCHMLRDNFTITLASTIGEDKGIIVEYGKNLVDVDKYEDIDNIVTKIYPTMEVNDVEYTLDEDYLENDIYDKKYVRHIEFEPKYAEYYDTLIKDIEECQKEIEDSDSANETIDKNEASVNEDIKEIEEDIAKEEATYTDLEKYVKTKINTSEDKLNNLYNRIMSKLNSGISYCDKKITQLSRNVNKYTNELKSLQDTINKQKTTLKKYTKKKYKKIADKLRKEISSNTKKKTKTNKQLSAAKKDYNKYKSQKKKLEEYKSKLKSASDLKESSIKSIINLLKADGIKIVGDMTAEYAKLTDTIKDKKSYASKMKTATEKILKLQNEIEEKNVMISKYEIQRAENNSTISENKSNIEQYTNTLKTEIQKDLKAQAQDYLNTYIVPQVSYKLECVTDNVEIGDVIEVKHGPMGLNLETSVITVVTDVVRNKIESVEFGNTDASIKAIRESIQNATDNKIANMQMLLQNSYSNVLETIDGIQGYIMGMQTEQVENGQLVDITSQMQIGEAEISSRVTEETAHEMITSEVSQKADEIKTQVKDQILEEINTSYLQLLTTHYVVPYLADGTPKRNENITLTAKKQNIDEETVWTTEPEITLNGTGNQRTIPTSAFANINTIKITVTAGEFSDYVTIVKIKDGTTGKDGKDGKDGTNGEDGKDGTDGTDGIVLMIDSSRGTVFKNDSMSTKLSVTIYTGSNVITNSAKLKEVFGDSATLQWKWLKANESEYGTISASDEHLQDNGFSFILSPDDVDEKITFMCELITN